MVTILVVPMALLSVLDDRAEGCGEFRFAFLMLAVAEDAIRKSHHPEPHPPRGLFGWEFRIVLTWEREPPAGRLYKWNLINFAETPDRASLQGMHEMPYSRPAGGFADKG